MSEQETTYLAPNTVLKGELQLAGPGTIAGRIEGAISGNNPVQVLGDGVVDGDIQGSVVDIQGSVKGNIMASQLCRLGATARVSGELRAANLAIVEGACFVGQVCVGGPAMEQELLEQQAAAQQARQAVVQRPAPTHHVGAQTNNHANNVMHEMAAASNRIASLAAQANEVAGVASDLSESTVNVVPDNIQNSLNRGPKIIRARS